MSVNLYGHIEVFNPKIRKWRPYKLYSRGEDDGLDEIFPISGGRSACDAVFGRETFDYVQEDEEFSKKSVILEHINDIIISAQGFDAYTECSEEVVEALKLREYDSYDYELGLLKPLKQRIQTVCYTYRDIMELDIMSMVLSKQAKRFFKKNFDNIRSTLMVICDAEYIFNSEHIRVILYTV